MIRSTEESVEILKSINFVDSSLFGLSIDIFKVRMLITCLWSPCLVKFGFEQHCELSFDFRHIKSFLFSVHKGLFGPPYLEDGALSAISLADFDIGELDVPIVGKTIPLAYGDEGEQVDEYEVYIPFRSNGSLKFRFAELNVGTFVPESLDERATIPSD